MSNMRDLWYDWLGMNTWLFKQINSLSEIPMYASLMKFVTIFGDKKILPIILVGIVIFAVASTITRYVMKKGGNTNYIFLWFNIFLMLGTGLLASHHMENYINKHYSYPRPYIALQKEAHQLEAQPAEDAYHSFPSWHAAIITILVFALWPVMSANFRWGGVFLIFFVCLSRVSLGVNYPMDVISGFTIALILMLIIRYILFSLISTIRHALKV
jgi:membrane-associated phospholipid phosphatase